MLAGISIISDMINGKYDELLWWFLFKLKTFHFRIYCKVCLRSYLKNHRVRIQNNRYTTWADKLFVTHQLSLKFVKVTSLRLVFLIGLTSRWLYMLYGIWSAMQLTKIIYKVINKYLNLIFLYLFLLEAADECFNSNSGV